MNKYEGFIGKVLDGRYKILELVGLGGMACVLKAQDLVMNRVVAIKILNDEYNGNEAAEARFIDESKAVAMLSNKNIVGVYDVAIYPDIKYIVMEYLDGITMREYLDNKGAIGWKEASIYMLQILRALEHAHSKGIIHRDIKPQNVMLTKNGDIKVTDFGIAKLPDSDTEQDEKAVGTVYYISPEQACGKQTDYYSDIYSVGIMFYEAVTGTLPFTAETPMEIAMMQVNDEPVHPRDIILDIPVGVSQIILKAMEKAPSDRFNSAHAMAKAIEWVLRYPEVIFAMSSASADENPAGNASVVSIDMISTAELEPYGDEEIAESLGTKKSTGAATATASGTAKPKQKKRRSKKSTSMFPIVFAISLAFFITLTVVTINVVLGIQQNSANAESSSVIKYPDIVGRIYDDHLYNELSNATYKFDIYHKDTIIVEEYHPELKHGEIISTEPEAHEERKVENDKEVSKFDKIVINRHNSVTIPNVMGYLKSKAEVELRNLGLDVVCIETNEVDNPYYNALQVVGVTPECGTTIKTGEKVTIIYYNPSSNNTAAMPDVVGLSAEEAKAHAEYAGFTVEIIEVQTAGGENKVVQQDIPEGTIKASKTKVILTVAVAPKTFIMPDLDMEFGFFSGALTVPGKGPTEVGVLFSELCPEMELNIVEECYSISEDELANFNSDLGDYTVDMLIKDYISIGLIKSVPKSETAQVYYQSIAAGTEVNKDDVAKGSTSLNKTQIKLIYFVIIPSENAPIVNPGDTSVPDDTTTPDINTDTSTDINSGVVYP